LANLLTDDSRQRARVTAKQWALILDQMLGR
jgi:hypothetical protein